MNDLRALLERSVRAGEPGAVVGVFRDGKLTESVAAGLASLEYSVPITTDTIFNIGSCSKQFTGTAALLLHAEGRIDLDAPIGDYLPELPVGDAISTRQCLQHTAGLYDYLSIGDMAGLPVGAMAGEPQFLAFLAQQRSTQFSPGSSVTYSNTNFVVAALAVQRAAGLPFDEILRTQIFKPLGMARTRTRNRVGLVVPDMAFSYEPADDGFVRHEMPEALPGDSNVLTSVADLAAWLGFLTGGHGLGERILADLITPGRLADGSATAYGLGIFSGLIDGVPSIGHSGSHFGYRAIVLCVPERNIGLVVLANRSDLVVRDLVTHFVTRYVATPRPAATDGISDPTTVEGDWYAAEVNELLQVRADGPDLIVTDVGTPRPVASAGPTAWASWDGLPSLHLTGTRLVWTNRIGRRTSFDRLANELPNAALTGTYRCAEPGIGLEVVGTVDELSYRPGDRTAVALTYAGRHGETYVYYAGWDVLAFTIRTGSPVTLAIRCENASVPGFVRDGDNAPG